MFAVEELFEVFLHIFLLSLPNQLLDKQTGDRLLKLRRL